MSEMPAIPPLLQAVRAVQELIDGAGGHGVLIGGIAVSLLGGARTTQDVDAG